MSAERYQGLVQALCKEVGIADAQTAIDRGVIEVGGYEVLVTHMASDEQAMYLNFNFGIASAGRTLRLFHFMLQSNTTIYAQDQAQLGVNPDTGGLLLIVRVPMTDELDGPALAETLVHYSEHGRYWRDTMYSTADEMYDGMPHTHFIWMRA